MNRVVNFLSHAKFVVRLFALLLAIVLTAIFVGALNAATSIEPAVNKTTKSTRNS